MIVTIREDKSLLLPPRTSMRIVGQIRDRTTLTNPKYVDALTHGRWTGNLEEYLEYHRYGPEGLLLPRGTYDTIHRIFSTHNVEIVLKDDTVQCPPVSFTSSVVLTALQERTVQDVLRSSKGQLVAPPGAGKTVMALEIVARRKQPTLWLTHTKDLVQQAKDRASTFLDLDPSEIGMVGDGKKKIGRRLTIATIQTLARGVPSALLEGIGHVIVDECHHIPAHQFAAVVEQFPAHYLLGLSATPYRRDGLDPVIEFYLGPISAEIRDEELGEQVVRPTIVKCDTGITVHGDAFPDLISALCADTRRTAMIVHDVVREVNADRQALVLTERVEHAEELARRLSRTGMSADVLHGGRSKTARAAVIARLHAKDLHAVVATSQLIGEGFDSPALSALFLATPLSWHGRLTQYLGRISRSASGKSDAIVYDYCDNHPMLWASWKKRWNAYDDAGYTILRPDSIRRAI